MADGDKTTRLQMTLSPRHSELLDYIEKALGVTRKEALQRSLEAYAKVVRLQLREEEKALSDISPGPPTIPEE